MPIADLFNQKSQILESQNATSFPYAMCAYGSGGRTC
jgi:hypothetical protein